MGLTEGGVPPGIPSTGALDSWSRPAAYSHWHQSIKPPLGKNPEGPYALLLSSAVCFTPSTTKALAERALRGGAVSIREKLFREFDTRKDLLEGQKQQGYTRVWTLLPRAWNLLPWPKARIILQELLEDSSVSGAELRGLLMSTIEREENPLEFLHWVREQRKSLTPDAFLWVIPRASQEYCDMLIDWIQEDPSAVDPNKGGVPTMVQFSEVLRKFPSQESERFLRTLLLSRNTSVQDAAREVLDDWKRIDEGRARSNNAEIAAALWKKADKTPAVLVRTLALKGLFDLGDKKAWLVLSGWLESKEAALREAAEELAGQIRSGK
jgi:hypothetical protein